MKAQRFGLDVLLTAGRADRCEGSVLEMLNLILGFATILASGVTSAFVTSYLNRNKEQTFFMRQKAEELYLAADEFGRGLSGYIFTFFPLVRGELSYDQFIETQKVAIPQKRHGGAEMMEMLTGIYFPEIEPQLKELLAARDEFNKLAGAYKAAVKEGAEDEHDWLPLFTSAMKRAAAAIKKLKEMIIKSARRHAGSHPRSRTANTVRPDGLGA